MRDLLLHPSVQKQVERFLKEPTHSICLIGPFGAGKTYTAHQIAQSLLGHSKPEAIKQIIPEKNSISIDAVRELQQFLKLKMPGTAKVRRIVIIENAEFMTVEAQNALLKTLEEPVDDVVFILTTNNVQQLLPTIVSRTQRLNVTSPSPEQIEAFFDEYPKAEIQRAYHMSGGNMGLMYALLNEKDHPLVEAISAGRQLINKNKYERQLVVDEWAKDKIGFAYLLFGLKRLLTLALTSNANNTAKLQKNVQGLASIHAAEKALGRSPNMKLLVTDLFLHL